MRWSSNYRVRAAPGFIEPCLPSPSKQPPGGHEWVFEIEHDGYRLMVRKDEDRVRIYTRRGADWTKRFPRVVDAVRRLKGKSILLDGEGIICREDGLADFELLHSKANDELVTFCAFDVIEHDGEAVRRHPLSERKALLKKLLGRTKTGIFFNEHFAGDGTEIFANACALGCEGIVAKRLDLPYQSGRSKAWLKIKNPKSPAVRRAEEGTF